MGVGWLVAGLLWPLAAVGLFFAVPHAAAVAATAISAPTFNTSRRVVVCVSVMLNLQTKEWYERDSIQLAGYGLGARGAQRGRGGGGLVPTQA